MKGLRTAIKKTFEELVKESKTLAESRTAREQRTAHNILTMKRRWDKKNEKILAGTLVRNHVKAYVVTFICSKCKSSYDHVVKMEVWSLGKLDGEDRWRATSEIRGSGMYDFHNDLPIKIRHEGRVAARCARCLEEEAEGRLRARQAIRMKNP